MDTPRCRHFSLFVIIVLVLSISVALISCGGSGGINNNLTYTVTYVGNDNTGGSVPTDSSNYKEGQTVTVLANTGNLTKINYTFAGWNTLADGTGTNYAQGQTFAMGSANVTLYAKWLSSPGSPTGVSASAKAQEIILQWSAVDTATSYNIYYSISSSPTKTSGTKISGVTSPYTHTHLSAGSYFYVVTAVNATGEGSESTVATASVNLVAFITSTIGNGNLSSWADAGGNTGLAAADAICQTRASAAGLTGNFKAWLSDTADDAYCRIHNLAGKKSANCGLGALPATAGPWVRTDGFPFADRIDLMINQGKTYSPPRYDEYGGQVETAYYFTATNEWGNLASITWSCSNWTVSASGSAGAGSSNATSWMWDKFSAACNAQTERLLCMQTDSGPSLSSFEATGKKVFLSSASGYGDLSKWADAGGNTGIAAGDAICQSLASKAGLANAANFKAWLSDASTNAIDRIASNGPWVRLDGANVADTKTDLVDASLFTPINLTETGVYQGNNDVWTGTASDGLKYTNTCNSWTDDTGAFAGLYGVQADAGSRWTSDPGGASCNLGLYRLYCFED